MIRKLLVGLGDVHYFSVKRSQNHSFSSIIHMRQSFLFSLLLIFTTNGFSQIQSANKKIDCVELVKRLSPDWKLDSSGNGGFRRENTKYLLACKTDGLTKDALLQSLGKPNQIRDTNKGKQYLYYYYDYRTLPKGKDGPLGYAYVYFTIPDGKNLVSYISEGDTDL